MIQIRQKEFEQLVQSALYRYHRSTKHTINSLLNNQYSLDWDNQPDPFRRYEGTYSILLPRDMRELPIGYFDLLKRLYNLNGIECNTEEILYDQIKSEARSIDLSSLSELLFFSMSISAWKQIVNTDHRWALRVNPSSGNLHPTEVHIAVKSLPDLLPGTYHYNVSDHSLERRCSENPFGSPKLEANQASVVICLTSIFWREAWKYRQRAFRYCQHDLGHALCAISLSAAMLGWHADVIGEFIDADIENLFGLADSDEKPMLLIELHSSSKNDKIGQKNCSQISMSIPTKIPELKFEGVPNVLSSDTVTYDEIEGIYRLTRRESLDSLAQYDRERAEISQVELSGLQSMFNDEDFFSSGAVLLLPSQFKFLTAELVGTGEAPTLAESARSLIRRRRSCLSLDGKQQMSLSHLSTILYSATRNFAADFCQSDPLIQLFIYLHRIDDVDPGLYLYDRNAQNFIRLYGGDCRDVAKFVSCFQDIAADGCFAVSMVADLMRAYRLFGDRGYRYVHYQAGYAAQLLYLSSLALGYESTGIGCFADDEINKMLKLAPGFEVIYNFTIGRAVADQRLTDLPAYKFLRKAKK